MGKTLVVGLGNPILGDDGVGWRVVEQVQSLVSPSAELEFDCLGLGGISLMERLIGYERAILVDAILTHTREIGSVFSLPLEEIPSHAAGHTSSAHDTTLQNALQMGRSLGAQLPQSIQVVAVEARQVYDFSEELSLPVAAAVPVAAQMVIDLLNHTAQEQ